MKFEKQKFSSSDKAVKDCKLSYQFVVRSFIAYILVFISYRKLNPHITVLNRNFVIKVKEKSIFIHNIEIPYIGDYIVIDKGKDYKS